MLGAIFVVAWGAWLAGRIARQRKVDRAVHDPLGLELDK